MKWRGRRQSTNILDLRGMKSIIIYPVDFYNVEVMTEDNTKFFDLDFIIKRDGGVLLPTRTVQEVMSKTLLRIGMAFESNTYNYYNATQRETLRLLLNKTIKRNLIYSISSPEGSLEELANNLLRN